MTIIPPWENGNSCVEVVHIGCGHTLAKSACRLYPDALEQPDGCGDPCSTQGQAIAIQQSLYTENGTPFNRIEYTSIPFSTSRGKYVRWHRLALRTGNSTLRLMERSS
ncbi:hypothetical protein Hypma_007217 [Hypsizygus marmoreus]|uniref:Uncharacterized protein n=1 Tax=Hypsizygus marmoreus TaxID=39966 RepID=A0A369KHY0_HYPMA|nr:hypothetical protein Hypma_007217 [Hypsizygus marmoreus]